MVKKLLSFQFRIFRHFVKIFRNLVVLRMSYLRNKMRFSKTFFAFTFFSEYSYKKKLLTCPGRRWNWVIFYCQSYDAIFAPKTVNIKKSKTDDCLKYKVLLSCKNSAQTVNNWKPCFNETTFWWLSGVQFPPLELLVGNSNRMQVLHQSYLASFLSRQKGNLPRN